MTACLTCRFPPATASRTEDYGFPEPGKASASACRCSLVQMQARLNVRACGNPALGSFPTGGDGELRDLVVSGLSRLLAFHPGGGVMEQAGVDASPLRTDGPAAPQCLHYLIFSLKCSRGPSN